jgi:hypothetical protein
MNCQSADPDQLHPCGLQYANFPGVRQKKVRANPMPSNSSAASSLSSLSALFPSRRFLLVALSCVLALLIVLPVYGQQQNSGGIKGTVRDPSSSVISGATVTAVAQDTGVSSATTTNSDGEYVLLSLPIGQYNLTIGNTGFTTNTIQNIRLVAGQTLTFDVSLAVGSVAQSVTVSGAAEQVDTTSSDMGSTLSTEELTSLPIIMGGNPRGALAFLTTQSGVNTKPGSGGIAAGGNQAANFTSSSIQGSSPFGGNQNNVGYSIDGVNAAYRMFQTVADFSSLLPEAIQEVRLASNFNAEQGWDNGVAVAYVTKSGTNQFHGSAFEYVQNTALDSRSWFSNVVASDHQNEFGGLFGGPIRKDKTFFFGSVDFFRYHHTPNGVVATVPTAAMQGGDFSQILGSQIGTDALGRPVYQNEIYDPTTTRTLANGTVVRDPYMCNGQLNVMCASAFSNVSKFFAGKYPTPTSAGIQNNWIGSQVASPLAIDKFSIKIDQAIGSKYKLMASLDAAPFYTQTSGSSNFGPTLTVTQVGPAYQYRPRAVLIGTLKPNLLFNVNFSASYVGSRLSTTGAATTAGQAAGLTGVYTANLPVVTITNTTGFGSQFLGYSNPQYALPVIGGFLAWVKGVHSFKFGADFMRTSIADIALDSFTAGQYNFVNQTTGLPGFSSTGWGFASFLTGGVNSGTLNTPETLHHYGQGWDVYAQDQWRITPKLTANFGLRWAAALGPYEQNDSYGTFDPTIPNPGAGGILGALTFWGNGAGRNGHHYLLKPNYNLWEPRVGLAYAFSQKMVVRAYYGLIDTPTFASFNQGTTASFYGAFAQITKSSTDNGITPAFNWDNGFPQKPTVPDRDPSLLNGSAVSDIDYNHNQAGRTQSFGLSLQRELPWGATFTAEYLGRLTHGLPLQNSWFYAPYNVGGFPGDQLDTKYLALGNTLLANINSPQAVAAGIQSPYPGFNGSVAQALLPFPQYSYIGESTNTAGFSEYNGGHFFVQKRFGSGLSMLLDYTFSKQLASGFFQANQYNTRKMLSPIDIPWKFAPSFSYDLPFGPGRPYLSQGIAGRVLGDWNLAGILNYQGGTVINVTTDATIPGITYLEPVRVAGQPFSTSVGCGNYNPNGGGPYLNPGAFAAPAPFTLGNIYELPDFRTCAYFTENLSVSKGFRVSEGSRLKFSANFFNAFNRHTWTGLQTDVNNPSTFGQFTGSTAPRSIQLAGRFEF